MTRDELISEFKSELKKALSRPHLERFARPGDEDLFCLLAQVCRAVAPEMWERSGKPYTAREVLRTAIEQLPDADRPDENPDHAAVTWREVGITLGDFRRDLPPRESGGDYDYKARMAVLKSESGIDLDYWQTRGERKLVDEFYKRLAIILLDMKKQAKSSPKESGSEDPGDSQGPPEVEENEEAEPSDPPPDSNSPGNTHRHESSDRNTGIFNFVFHGPVSIGDLFSRNKGISLLLALVLVATGGAAIATQWPQGEANEASTSADDSPEQEESGLQGEDSLTVTLLWSGERGHYVAFPQDKMDLAHDFISNVANTGQDETAGISPNGISPFEDIFAELYREIGRSVDAGAYHTNDLYVHVELEGRNGREVTVYDVRPVVTDRSAIPEGLLFVFTDAQGDGPDAPRNLWFPMDDARPLAREGDPFGPPASDRSLFFQSERIGLNDGSKETLIMSFSASQSAVEFNIAIDYEVDGEKYSKILHDDEDEPIVFRVAGGLYNPPELSENTVPEDGAEPGCYSEAWAMELPAWELEEQDPEMYCLS